MSLLIKKLSRTDLERNIAFKNHEQVYKYIDPDTGLVAFIAIHSSRGGSAVGGTRFFPYDSEEEALTDVLNLSHSMSYKCAVAGIEHGGGKGVIIGNPKSDKNPELLDSYAQAVKSLSGKFYTGEDVGLDEADVQFMLAISPYFIGKSDQAGDPSEYASLSVYTVMKVAVEKVFSTDDLSGRSIAIKGLGKVGLGLLKLLARDKPRIYISDIDGEAVIKAKVVYPDAEVVNTEEIHKVATDIYAPCAMGNEFTLQNIADLKAKIICGGANNQIVEMGVDEALYNSNILYVPDYLANAGGLINVSDELEQGGYKIERVFQRIKNLEETFETFYTESRRNGKSLLSVTNASVERAAAV